MIKRLFWDERGDLSFFTIFVILSINMVMAFLLLFATIRIECINIRNAAKMELNNVSAESMRIPSTLSVKPIWIPIWETYTSALPTKTHSGQILSRD